MNRIAVTDKDDVYVGWFYDEKAKGWEEGEKHNGHNMISLATNSQWTHERLYCSSGGRWILHHWSQRPGGGQRYRAISAERALQWLIENEHELPAILTELAAGNEL